MSSKHETALNSVKTLRDVSAERPQTADHSIPLRIPPPLPPGKPSSIRPLPTPPVSMETGAIVLVQKRIAEATAKVESLNQEIDERNRLAAQMRSDLEILQLDAQAAEQRQKNLETQNQKSRATLEQLGNQIVLQSAKLEAMFKTISLYEKQVAEKKESCQQQMTRLSAELFEDAEKMQALRRQMKETTKVEIEKERDTIRGEVEQFKNDAWARTQAEFDRFEGDIKKKKSALLEELRRMNDEAREKGKLIIKQAEEVAKAIRSNAEEKVADLTQEAHNRLFQTQKQAEKDLAEVRRRHDEAEYQFIQEKSSTVAKLKNLEKESRQEADRLVAEARERAAEELRKTDLKITDMMEHAQRRASEIIKDANRTAAEIIEREKTEIELEKNLHLESLERARATAADAGKEIIEKARADAQKLLLAASEQAKVLSLTAQEECDLKKGELADIMREKTQEAEKASKEVLKRAAGEAQTIVDRAKTRALNIDGTVNEILANAQKQADKIVEDTHKQLADTNATIKLRSERLAQLQTEETRLDRLIKERRKNADSQEIRQRKSEQEAFVKINRERRKTVIYAIVLGLLAGLFTVWYPSLKAKDERFPRKEPPAVSRDPVREAAPARRPPPLSLKTLLP